MSLQAHLETGVTTLARAWAIDRRDGVTLGFTDHDHDLEFEGIRFRASSGMTARALQQTTGLAVDNTEAVGALSDASITEANIRAGRFDGAALRIWLVNWANTEERRLEFRGSLGEVVRTGAAFRAELRGLGEALTQAGGRVFQSACTAALGDARCGFDVSQPGYRVELPVQAVEDDERLFFPDLAGFAPRWFEKGMIEVQSGRAAKLTGAIKDDRSLPDGRRRITLWQRLGAELAAGDLVSLTAGCDKQPDTCRVKFSNFLNFQGFPHIPGEDWLMAVPRQGGVNDGGSLKR